MTDDQRTTTGEAMTTGDDLSPAAAAILQAFAPGLVGPRRGVALVGLAGVLQAKGMRADATRLALRAMTELPDDPEVAARARALVSRGVPRWHIPMLHDRARAAAYARSLEAAVRPGMLVLDIGTGSGLLALLAARAGADLVVACEQDPALAVVAVDNVRRNGHGDRVQVVAKHSRDLVVGEDLPRPADLLVSEIVDGLVLGEDILDTVEHARAHLLAPGAPALPGRATVHVALGHADTPKRTPIDVVEGIDVSTINAVAGPMVSLNGRPTVDVLTTSEALFELDLSGRPVVTPRTATTSVRALAGGTATVILQWMSLDLGPGIDLSSGPGSESFAWTMQSFALPRPLALDPGQAVDVHGEHARRSLLLWATPDGPPPR